MTELEQAKLTELRKRELIGIAKNRLMEPDEYQELLQFGPEIFVWIRWNADGRSGSVESPCGDHRIVSEFQNLLTAQLMFLGYAAREKK
jgi:hypothetical protein